MDVFDRSGEPLAIYAKSHLVPFGEYLPFQKYWPVTPPAVTAGTFSAGTGPVTFQIKKLPSFSAFVCYEVIFPEEIVDAHHRPQFLLNVTNDAWYGHTSGPYQHLAIAQTRAVEQGLPMIRAANTGISAMIDPQGRLIAKLGLGELGRLDVALPQPLKRTFFADYGPRSWLLLLALALLAAFLGHAAQQKRPTAA
jgi:apolipoprotein N-acyltransferase